MQIINAVKPYMQVPSILVVEHLKNSKNFSYSPTSISSCMLQRNST